MALQKINRVVRLNLTAHRTPLFLGACAAFYLTADHMMFTRLWIVAKNAGLAANRDPMKHLRPNFDN